MPKCKNCRFQGPYIIDNYGMRCQAPGGGPTQNSISLREACADLPCDFFQPQEKSKLKVETIVKVEADSLEAARTQVRSQMREGMSLLAEQVISGGEKDIIFFQIGEKKISPEKLAVHLERQRVVNALSVDWSHYGPMPPKDANIKKVFSSSGQAVDFVIERHRDNISDCNISWRSDEIALIAEFYSAARNILRERFAILHMPDGYLCYMAYLM